MNFSIVGLFTEKVLKHFTKIYNMTYYAIKLKKYVVARMLFKASDTLFSRLSKKIPSHYFYCKKLELGVFNVYHELPDYSRVHTVFRLHDGYFYYYPTNYYTCLKKIQVKKSSFLPCQFIKINPDLNGNQ